MPPQIYEITKRVRVRSPRGEAVIEALIDTGASVCLFTKGVLDRTGLEAEKVGELCGILACTTTKSGYVTVALEGCPERRVMAMQGDFNLLGQNYMTYTVESLNPMTGEYRCIRV